MRNIFLGIKRISFVSNKIALYLGMFVAMAMRVLAYHGTGTRAQLPSQGTPLSGWVLLVVGIIIALCVWLFIRWWKKL